MFFSPSMGDNSFPWLYWRVVLLCRKGMFGLKLKKKKKDKAEKGLVLTNKGAQGEVWGGLLLTTQAKGPQVGDSPYVRTWLSIAQGAVICLLTPRFFWTRVWASGKSSQGPTSSTNRGGVDTCWTMKWAIWESGDRFKLSFCLRFSPDKWLRSSKSAIIKWTGHRWPSWCHTILEGIKDIFQSKS